jgi:ribosomal protein S18 acetylase RimI-like enzyme
MQIRLYDDSDEAAVVGLWRQAFLDDPPHNNPALVVRRKGDFQRELFFIAEHEGVTVGSVMAGYDGHRGRVYTVVVHPGHRRRGIGTALVRYAEAALKAMGCPKINVQVRSSDTGVTALFQKLGYQIEPRISLGKRLPSSGGLLNNAEHDTGGEG